MKKTLIKYIVLFICIIALFIALLTLTSLIPRESIEEHTQESAEILNEQGNSLYIPVRGWIMMFDNFTDALMINTAYSIDNNAPLYSAMVARKNYIPGVTKTIYEDDVGKLKSASKYDELDQVGELNDTVNGDIEESFEYARYWHGYLVLLRPALLLGNIGQIRIALIYIFIILLAILTIILAKKSNVLYALAVASGVLGIDYLYIGLTLQSTPVFLVTIISSIIVALMANKMKNIYMPLFIIGMITSYVDFLTVPIISLGLPLTVYFLVLQKQKTITLKETIKIIVIASINWGIGYVFTWFSKWVIVDVLYGKNVIGTAIGQTLYRTIPDANEGFLQMASKAIEIIKENIIFLLFASMLITIIRETINRNKPKSIKDRLIDAMPYVIIMIMPFAWYFVFEEHSISHIPFTYRSVLLLLTSIPLIILKMSEREKIKDLKMLSDKNEVQFEEK